MANNRSFGKFFSFGRQSNTAGFASDYDNGKVVAELDEQHAKYETWKSTYDLWAKNTVLRDSVSPLTGIKFSELFVQEDGKDGQFAVIVFNPNGTRGTSWSKNTSGFVNGLLHAFGTLRYETLNFGLHERPFDRSLAVSHNVRSVYNKVTQQWVRQDYKGERYTDNTPYWKSEEGAGWLAKHSELNLMIQAVLGNQSIRYNFFNEISWARFDRNVLANMGASIENVNIMMAGNAQYAGVLNKTENEVKRMQAANGVTPAETIVKVDGLSLNEVKGVFHVDFVMSYGHLDQDMENTPTNRAYVASLMASKKFVSGKVTEK